MDEDCRSKMTQRCCSVHVKTNGCPIGKSCIETGSLRARVGKIHRVLSASVAKEIDDGMSEGNENFKILFDDGTKMCNSFSYTLSSF